MNRILESVKINLANANLDASRVADAAKMFASAYGDNYKGDDSLRIKIYEGDHFLGLAIGGGINGRTHLR